MPTCLSGLLLRRNKVLLIFQTKGKVSKAFLKIQKIIASEKTAVRKKQQGFSRAT